MVGGGGKEREGEWPSGREGALNKPDRDSQKGSYICTPVQGFLSHWQNPMAEGP